MKLNPFQLAFVVCVMAAVGISAARQAVEEYREWRRFKKDQKRKPYSL